LFQYRSGLYGTTSYYFSKAIVEIPGFAVRSALFLVIVYFMWGLDATIYKIFIFLYDHVSCV